MKNLITIDDTRLLIWDPKGHIICRSIDDQSNSPAKNKQAQKEVKLMLTERPYFWDDVLDISLSPNKSMLALRGSKGVCIVDLPRRWGSQYKDVYYCKTWNINERQLSCTRGLQVYQVLWHPCSKDELQILCVLTNDNFLRLYDARQHRTDDDELQSVDLSRTATNDHDVSDDILSATMSRLDLGEVAVAFDFGPPISVFTGDPLWPIYFVKGTGEVLLVYSTPLNPSYTKKVFGPLTMLPQADDNYGSDACSLIVLDSFPPLLAIATSSGSIYHCFAISDDTQGPNQSRDILPNQTLYVYDIMQLSLNLTDYTDEPFFTYQMRLHKDKTSKIRYFCTHPHGIHMVIFPIIETVEAGASEISNLRVDIESFAEYLICTKPLPLTNEQSDEENPSDSYESSPRGLVVEAMLANVVLITLLDKNEIVTRRLRPAATLNCSHFSNKKEDKNSSRANESQILESSRIEAFPVNFEEKIQMTLRRKMGVPLLKSSDLEEKSLHAHQEGSELILDFVEKTTTIIRSEFVERFKKASESILKKFELLKADAECQSNEMENIIKQKEEVFNSFIAITTKADKACQTQESLLNRITSTLERLRRRQSELSDAECKLKLDMLSLRSELKLSQDRLDSVRSKSKYQKDLDEKMKRSNSSFGLHSTDKDRDTAPTENQLAGIKEILQRQGNEIAELKKMLRAYTANGLPAQGL